MKKGTPKVAQKNYKTAKKRVMHPNQLSEMKNIEMDKLKSKKEIFKLLTERLHGDSENYNTLRTNILIQNLYKEYPNYLKEFEKRSKEKNSK